MKKRGQIGQRFLIYLIGLLIMSLGIVLLILADLGPTSWDVLHVGLYYQLGLTIGSWSIIVGIVILMVTTLLTKKIPQFGAFLNMVLIGSFIDLYMLLPFMTTPTTFFGKCLLFLAGVLIYCYGMGIYISAQLGAGPRDSLMLALTSITGWKVQHVRVMMEILVFVIGWLLGGPAFWGTIILSVSIGWVVGFALPQCQRMTNALLQKTEKMKAA